MADLSKDTLLFAKERRKMCNSFECKKCPIFGLDDCMLGRITGTEENDKEVLQIVQHWSDKRQRATYLQDFLEKLPDAVMDAAKIPSVCRRLLYITPNCKSDCELC